VLAWNIRLGAEHAGLDFWLSSICCHAPNAPIFVVGTHSDQVSRVDLRQDDFQRRYPQIAGFFNVSTTTSDQMSSLIENIINTTLTLPYMGELIPKAWLGFENLVSQCQEDILKYQQIEEVAHNAGIFEASEILQAVQFLHDLGSLQYFSSEYLKDYVVINPQWIVNVMACIVSIKDSPVKNGRLHHTDIGTIWQGYNDNLHPWILKLTEAFDLTFPVVDQQMNLVPCLLPEAEPEVCERCRLEFKFDRFYVNV
jgi:leucine-rich repeat kinase 2